MSGDESFFPRWSRRKRSAAATARQSAKPNLPVIPTQKTRDLLYREAAQEQVAQLRQLHFRPFPAGVRGRWFVLNGGALRIDDRGPNDAE